MPTLGIDIGGTGIKGALVDTDSGELATDRLKIPTPRPSTPKHVAKVVKQLAEQVDYAGAIGCTFPAVVAHGVVHTAANVDDSWIGTDAAALFSERTGCPVTVLNDADAAGIAEMAHGVGRGHDGTVIMLTLGTGIGSAVFVDGTLVPNTELGHLEVRGKEAEHRASNEAREQRDLSWEEYGGRLDEVLHVYEDLFWPDLFVIGGGISKKADRYLPALTIRTPVIAAELRNNAGIVGAAMAATGLASAPLAP